MKLFLSFTILFLLTLSVDAQIDSQKKSIAIPAIESKKETNDTQKITPSQRSTLRPRPVKIKRNNKRLAKIFSNKS